MNVQQAERRRRFVDVAELVAEERLGVVQPGVRERLRNMVSIRHCRSECPGAAREARHHLREHGLHRIVIMREVMQL